MARTRGRRRAVPVRPGAHRAERTPTRVRWGRLGAVVAAAVVTVATIAAGVGLGPGGSGEAYAEAPDHSGAVIADAVRRTAPAPTPAPEQVAADAVAAQLAQREDTTLPSNSGEGRRIVFDADRQRVWLVAGGAGERSRVVRTYLVSGSALGNLRPGSYAVYSRSRHATAIDDAGTMRWMVRFARGERAAIGFHDIPVHRGERVQTPAELGTALSAGCIRQATPDARALWRFARLGTPVVVTS